MRVSVVIPTFGTRQGATARAVASAVAQCDTHSDLEVMLVDDCTPDRSVEDLAASLSVRYVRRQVNGGVSAAQNTGVAAATGDAVCFLHSDDEMPPGRIAAQVEAGVEGVVGGHRLLNGQEVGDVVAEGREALLWRRKVHIAPYMFRRDVLMRHPFDEQLRGYEDWDLLFRLVQAGVPYRLYTGITAVIHDDGGPRLSHSASLSAESLLYLYGKYRSEIEIHRRLRARWEFLVAQQLLLSGDGGTGRRWAARSLLRDPAHPRRLWWAVRGPSKRIESGSAQPQGR